LNNAMLLRKVSVLFLVVTGPPVRPEVVFQL